MDSGPHDVPSSPNPLCGEIESLLLNGTFACVQIVQFGLLLITLLSVAFLVKKFNSHRPIIHGNLLLLFSNLIAVSFFHSLGHFLCILRYRVLVPVYKDPCDMLTPIWMVILFYGPTYLYYAAYPAFHFCVMIERFRATLLADKYEWEDQRLGIWMATMNWFLSLAFTAFVICSALADTDLFGHPQGVLFLTSKYNNIPIFYVSIFTLFLTILTALCDWRITMVNRRIRTNTRNGGGGMTAYSLSRNYQVNENVLAMRLILPLDTAYALLYSLYNLILILLRAYRSTLGTRDFAYYYSLANTLLFLYSTVCMIVYIRYINFMCRCRRRDVSQKSGFESEAKIYFRQLKEQWD